MPLLQWHVHLRFGRGWLFDHIQGGIWVDDPETFTRWCFQRFFIFHPYLGEDFHFDEHIFQMGVETTNQFRGCLSIFRGRICLLVSGSVLGVFVTRKVVEFHPEAVIIAAWLMLGGEGFKGTDPCSIHSYCHLKTKTITPIRIRFPEGKLIFQPLWIQVRAVSFRESIVPVNLTAKK